MSEKIKTAIDLSVLLTVEIIADAENKPFEEVLPDFVRSDTGKLLYDENSKLWWSSPAEIADMYLCER